MRAHFLIFLALLGYALTAHCAPDTLLGCIDASSGTLSLSQTDLVVRCAEPITITRTLDGTSSDFRHIWRIEEEKITFSIGRQTHRSKRPEIILETFSGAQIPFELDSGQSLKSASWTASVPKMERLPIAFSAHDAIQNFRLKFDSKSSAMTLTTGSGELRLYEAVEGKRWYDPLRRGKNRHLVTATLRLTQIRRPCGRSLVYKYDNEGRLRRIEALCGERVFGWVTLDYEEKPNFYAVYAVASDGQTLDYCLKKWGDRVMSMITLPKGGLEISTFRRCDGCFALCKHRSPKGLDLEFAGESGRVETLFKDSRPLARLSDAGGMAALSTCSGSQRRIGRWPGGPVILIQHYSPYLHHQERFSWEHGRLTRWSLLDARRHTLLGYRFAYDERGNATSRQVYGPDGICSERSLSFSDDGLNLLTSESDGRTRIEYSYPPNTDLCSAALTYEGDAIQERHFCEYDEMGFPSRAVWDDGSSPTPGALDDVTYRRIRMFERFDRGPHCGLVSSCNDYFLDIDSGEERLLGRKLYHYSRENLVTCVESFDAEGQLCSSREREFDTSGSLIREHGSSGPPMSWERSPSGQICGMQRGHLQLRLETTQLGKPALECYRFGKEQITIDHEYDLLGRETSRVHSALGRTEYLYDPLGQLTEKIFPDGTSRSWTFDEAGRIAAERHRSGESLERRYDPCGRLIAATFDDGTEVFWEYDFQGHLVKRREPDGTVWEWDRDYRGRATREEVFDSQGRQLARRTASYKGAHLLSTSDSLGNSVCYAYDGAGRLVREGARSYAYDARGRLARVTEELPSGPTTVAWEWDAVGAHLSLTADGRVTEKHFSPTGKLEEVVRPSGTLLRYSYDDLDRCISWEGPDFGYRYAYDNAGRLSSVTSCEGVELERIYSPKGDLTTERLQNGLEVAFEYDELGRRTKLSLPDGSSIAYRYGERFLESVVRCLPDGTEHYSQTFESWDARGLPLRVRLPGDAGLLEYTWDGLRRLIEVEDPRLCLRASYDLAGYLSSYELDGQVHPLTYDATGRLPRSEEGSYSHDADGRVVEWRSGNSVTRYRYDSRENLIELESGTQRLVFTYDCLGRRMTREAFEQGRSLGLQRFIWDGALEIGLIDEDGKLAQLRVPAHQMPHGTSLASVELRGIPYVPFEDLCGSSLALCNLSGELVERSAFSSFGRPLSGPVLNPWAFSGARYEPHFELHLFGVRALHGPCGRWLTPDPAGYAQGLDLYEYCFGNPWRYRDPDGRFVLCLGLPLAYLTLKTVVCAVAGGVALGTAVWACTKLKKGRGQRQQEGQLVDAVFSNAAHPRPTLDTTTGLIAVPGAPPSILSQPRYPVPPIVVWSDATLEAEPELGSIPGTYRPGRPLPQGDCTHYPDTDVPHTQLGTKQGGQGDYTQAREWGYDADGNLIPQRDIDFTDHGYPKNHPNPHQHRWTENSTGGSRMRDDPEPMRGVNDATPD